MSNPSPNESLVDYEGPPATARPARIAILEANRFHEEVVFALASAAARVAGGADLTVFAPNHWAAREFLREDLRLRCRWRPFPTPAVLRAAAPGFDLVMVATFPSPAGQPAVDAALATGVPVLGLVHDVEYFVPRDAVQAALRRWPNLVVGYPGPAPARPVREFPAPLRPRLVRFVPVLPYGGGGAPERTGVMLPGAIEFARRDIPAVLRLTARSRVPLLMAGRSADHGDGPKRPRDLDADRRRLDRELAASGAAPYVTLVTDVPCGDFYRLVAASRFVAVMPADGAYLRGKLTGAVTAAMSCAVPMLAAPTILEYYAGADPATFAGCMVRCDPQAPLGHPEDWGSIVRGTTGAPYRELCRQTAKARDALLAENTATVEAVAGR